MERYPLLSLLKDRVDLKQVPFTERGSRLLVLENPDGGLIIRLAERWVKVDPRVTGYLERPPIVDHMYLADGEGNPLKFDLESYPHRLNFLTRIGTFSLIFDDTETLLLSLPEVACGVCFQVRVNEGSTDRRGGVLHVTGQVQRSLAYTTNRPIESNTIEQVSPGLVQVNLTVEAGEEAGLLINLTPRLGYNRYVPHLEAAFHAAARRWEHWFETAPEVDGPYRAQYYYAWYIMRAGLISSRYFTTREAMTPSKVFYVGIWQWDAYFHAIAYRHIDQILAQNQFRIMLDHQRNDGMIPDAVHDEGTITQMTYPVAAEVTKPPLLAWAAWKLYEINGDREFIAEIYDDVAAWNEWWFTTNDIDGDGLAEYQHPYSSGLDDSPLWDQGMPVTSPDLNTYLYLQMESLGQMARVLNLFDDARRWHERAQDLLDKMIKLLWDDEKGAFMVMHQGLQVEVMTPFNLLPLMSGSLPEEMAARLVEHIQNPDEFWTKFPLPTVASNDPKYSPQQMWRGPTWVNVNYMLIEGLERSGYPDVAEELRERTFEMVAGLKDIYEYYNPETGQAPPLAASTFGWSAALFIDLMVQSYGKHHTEEHMAPEEESGER